MAHREEQELHAQLALSVQLLDRLARGAVGMATKLNETPLLGSLISEEELRELKDIAEQAQQLSSQVQPGK